MLSQCARQHELEPDPVEQGMARGRWHHHRLHVLPVDEPLIERAVEEQDEPVLRMCLHDAPQRFVREPADAFELVGKQQACVYGYSHSAKKAPEALSCAVGH